MHMQFEYFIKTFFYATLMYMTDTQTSSKKRITPTPVTPSKKKITPTPVAPSKKKKITPTPVTPSKKKKITPTPVAPSKKKKITPTPVTPSKKKITPISSKKNTTMKKPSVPIIPKKPLNRKYTKRHSKGQGAQTFLSKYKQDLHKTREELIRQETKLTRNLDEITDILNGPKNSSTNRAGLIIRGNVIRSKLHETTTRIDNMTTPMSIQLG
jgi:hypothetical protein